ncbi:MAG: hypothetical protein ACK4FA_01965 [Candidatus Paceibacteria bacterium]
MKNILPWLAFFCWNPTNAQQPNWLAEVVSLPSFEDAHSEVFEPQITFTLDQEWDFHHFSLSMNGTLSALNGITVGKDFYPYIFLSYNPWHKYSYTSIGISKDVSESIVYIEFGFSDADFKNWGISVGMIYSIDIPKINFKNKKRGPS